MFTTPSTEKIINFNLDNVKVKDKIIFCPECNFYSKHYLSMTICPECSSHLNLTSITDEILVINRRYT